MTPPPNIPYKPPEPGYRFLGCFSKVPTFFWGWSLFKINQSVLPFGCDVNKKKMP